MRHTGDDAVEISQQPTDIANVRDRAWTPAHAEAEGAGDVQPAAPDDPELADGCGIRLDPVGVLVRETSTSVESLFASLRKLISTSDVGAAGDTEPVADDPDAPTDSVDDASTAPTIPDDKADPRDDSSRPHRVKRDATPLNEFSENAAILYGSYWDLFPLRSGLKHDGPLHPTQRRHLLTQFHNGFAQRSTFLFLLANQIQRHAATQGVALRVQSDADSFAKFGAFVADTEGFTEKLTSAEAAPTSVAARNLVKYVTRFVSGAGRIVPRSTISNPAKISYSCSRP